MKRARVNTLSLVLSFVFVFTLVFTNEGIVRRVMAEEKAMVAHYKFDGDAKDSSGYGNDGIIKGTGQMRFDDESSGGAINGQSAVFDGQYIEVNDSNSLDLTTAFTISVWLYKEPINDGDKHDHNWAPIVVKGDGQYEDKDTPYALMHNYENYSPAVRLIDENNSETLTSSQEVSVQKWHLITVTWNGTFIRYYVNGTLVDTQTFKGNLIPSSQKLMIGCNIPGGTYFYKGKMDDLRIYNYELDENSIRMLYSNFMGTKSNDGKMVAYYKFDGDLTDSSQYKNNGIVQGSPFEYLDVKDGKAMAGKAAVFDGNRYIEVKDNDSLDFSKAFTASLWLYKGYPRNEEDKKNRSMPLLAKGDSQYVDETTPYAITHNYDNYSPAVRLVNHDKEEILTGDFEVSPEKWHMLTVVWNGEDVKFYINKILRDTQPWKGELFSSDGKLLIGACLQEGTTVFKGLMDELKLFDYALSQDEIDNLYAEVDTSRFHKMVAYFPFDKDYNDYSDFKNTISKTVGKMSITNGVVANSANFDGNSYIVVNDSDSLDVDSAFSYSVWLNKNDPKSEKNKRSPILTKGDGEFVDECTPYALYHSYDGLNPVVRLTKHDNEEELSSDVSAPLGTWHHLVVTWDGKEINYYINGKLADTKEWEGELFHSNQKLYIGCSIPGGTLMYSGLMDELRIYNYALSEKEVQNLYNPRNSITVSVSGVTVSTGNKITTVKNKTAVFTVTVAPPKGTLFNNGAAFNGTVNASITSSNTKVVQIMPNKSIKAIGKGTATISIKYGDKTVNYTVTVK